MKKIEKVLASDRLHQNVLDYVQAVDYIDSVLGFGQRHAHEKFPEQGNYLDYWHYVLHDFFDERFLNGSYVTYGPHSFQCFYKRTLERFGESDWRTIIAKVWAEEYPDPESNDLDNLGYEIWMDW